MTPEEEFCRAKLSSARRIVVKVGTRLLTQESGEPDFPRIQSLSKSLVRLKESGIEVVLVTSGAIAMGVHALKFAERPKTLPELQMAAAVGQTRLMNQYTKEFSRYGIGVGQVLLTHDDLRHRVRHLNARNTMMSLLRHGLVPIVNENDAVAVEEIKLGDNDTLGALVALLVDADLLILLTTVEGLLDTSADQTRIPFLDRISPETYSLAVGKGSALSTGGMTTKLRAAEMLLKAGKSTVIASGRERDILRKICSGAPVGTLFAVSSDDEVVRRGRKRWLAFFHRPAGVVVIDDGAEQALVKRGKSLLPAGILTVQGEFSAGSLVEIVSRSGEVLGRGLVSLSSELLEKTKRRKSAEIRAEFPEFTAEEAVHRDNFVLFRNNPSEHRE